MSDNLLIGQKVLFYPDQDRFSSINILEVKKDTKDIMEGMIVSFHLANESSFLTIYINILTSDGRLHLRSSDRVKIIYRISQPTQLNREQLLDIEK